MRRVRLPKLGIGPQIVAALLILGLVGAMAIEPTRQLVEQRDRIAGMSHDLQKLERSNEHLGDRITRLRDPDFLEQRAREIGLVRANEIPYVVMLPGPGERKAGEDKATPKEAPPPPQTGFLDGMLHFLGVR
ncbi:MAG: Septum formation initiator [Actinomycetota bacterium]|nr:Septum formation initiator [Actinomycetota bacterium]